MAIFGSEAVGCEGDFWGADVDERENSSRIGGNPPANESGVPARGLSTTEAISLFVAFPARLAN
jgi:hypothetical protein